MEGGPAHNFIEHGRDHSPVDEVIPTAEMLWHPKPGDDLLAIGKKAQPKT
jgi:hypothetical protein